MDPCGTPQTISLGGDKQLFTWHRCILLINMNKTILADCHEYQVDSSYRVKLYDLWNQMPSECPGTQRLLNFLGPYYDTIRHTCVSMLTELNVWGGTPTGNQTIMLCQINTYRVGETLPSRTLY